MSDHAAARGWTVVREANDGASGERLRLTRRTWSLVAVFSHDGAFSHARTTAPATADTELDLPATLDVIDRYGSPHQPHSAAPPGPDPRGLPATAPPVAGHALPEETPAAESSTTAGISVPEPPELSRAWGAWPLIVIAVLVVCVIVFMIARIFAF
ncbi:DUF6480 family protein [Kitasatospora sp. NBC_01539]|uniref:DUF6480 family protein n=1 Tax=Kitasatospora sp. NBC_01539 TaxID=2903577 RepID=UPI0038601EFE